MHSLLSFLFLSKRSLAVSFTFIITSQFFLIKFLTNDNRITSPVNASIDIEQGRGRDSSPSGSSVLPIMKDFNSSTKWPTPPLSSSLSFSQAGDIPKETHSFRVFWCGYPDFAENMAKCLFDDTQNTICMLSEKDLGSNHSMNDVLVASFSGPCIVHNKAGTNAPVLFKGPILYTSGEPEPLYPLDIRDRLFALTYSPDDGERNIRSYFGAMYASCMLPRIHGQRLFDANTKPQNSGDRFLIYANSRCNRHREVAFAKISHLGRSPAYYGGRCRGRPSKANTTMLDEEMRKKRKWMENHLLLQKYRFALVMENTKKDGYITEKIINAFLAGCVPIYYGTQEIFDIFNSQAFIYYDIESPQDALDRIAYLEQNETAYMDMLKNQPILKNGKATMKEYFSFSDDLGGGHLKKRIRNMMGNM